MRNTPPRIATAACRLSSWFSAVGIVNSLSREEDAHLTVLTGSGSSAEIRILSAGSKAPRGCAYIWEEDINRNEHAVAMFAFLLLCQVLGHHPDRLPVDRGPETALREDGQPKRLSYHENFECVAMRHRQLRMTANPNPQRYERYKPVIARCCRRFFARNAWLCQRCLLTIGDLNTYALVWTTNFLGNFELQGVRKVEENDKLLTDYLKQCFFELYQLLIKKNRNVLPDFETAYLFQMGKPHEYHSGGTQSRGAISLDEPEEEIDLERTLRSMPRDEAVKILSSVIQTSADPEVQSAARAQLRKLGARSRKMKKQGVPDLSTRTPEEV